MALTTTTLSAAVTADAKQITVASATSISSSSIIKIDGEVFRVTKDYTVGSTTVPVLRGRMGTAAAAHPTTSNVVHSTDPADFSGTVPGGNWTFASVPVQFDVKSYTAAGAIDLPTSASLAVRVLNGTSVLAMTIAAPGKDIDGATMIIVGNGAAAHTLTFSGGLSGAGTSYDVYTNNASAPTALLVVACNGKWICPVAPPMTGTVTNITGGID